MFNYKKFAYKVIFYISFMAAILFILFMLADIYQNKDTRENMVFLCTFVACAAAVGSIFLTIENNIERKRLIKAIDRATDEIQNLKNAIAKLGSTSARKR